MVHSNNNGIVFLSGRAINDYNIKDELFLETFPDMLISIERLEMYRKDVMEVPQAYGADITLKVPEGIELKPKDVLLKKNTTRLIK
ncbi:hypothetical protein GCM10022393_42690 [Aquimarina addita]|uniref:Uncharacterized protein n=1 Tax=Aquimarina addita TaxID=870485 RepID=A0ABP6UVG9_9FLAO